MEAIKAPKGLIGISELYEKIFDVYKKRFETITLLSLLMLCGIAVAFIVSVLIFVISFGLGVGFNIFNNEFSLEMLPGLLQSGFGSFIACVISNIVLSTLVSVWLSGAIIFTVVSKSKVKLVEALSKGWKHFVPVLWIVLIIKFVTAGGFVFMLIPGVFLSVALSFSLYVHFAENVNGIAAVIRSYDLVKGHWWGVFGRFFAVIVPMVFLFFFVALIFSAGKYHVINSVINTLGFLIFLPIFSILVGILYDDLLKINGGVKKPVTKGREWKYGVLGGIGLLATIGFISVYMIVISNLLNYVSDSISDTSSFEGNSYITNLLNSD